MVFLVAFMCLDLLVKFAELSALNVLAAVQDSWKCHSLSKVKVSNAPRLLRALVPALFLPSKPMKGSGSKTHKAQYIYIYTSYIRKNRHIHIYIHIYMYINMYIYIYTYTYIYTARPPSRLCCRCWVHLDLPKAHNSGPELPKVFT